MLFAQPSMVNANARLRAMSLLELTAVIAVLGVLAIAGISRFGSEAIANGAAQGLARKLSLALTHARRATIATGDNHYVQLTPSSGDITAFATIRRGDGGDVQIDQSMTVPADVNVTSIARELEFDFDGSALSSYNVTISAPTRSWQITVVPLTGAIRVIETTL